MKIERIVQLLYYFMLTIVVAGLLIKHNDSPLIPAGVTNILIYITLAATSGLLFYYYLPKKRITVIVQFLYYLLLMIIASGLFVKYNGNPLITQGITKVLIYITLAAIIGLLLYYYLSQKKITRVVQLLYYVLLIIIISGLFISSNGEPLIAPGVTKALIYITLASIIGFLFYYYLPKKRNTEL